MSRIVARFAQVEPSSEMRPDSAVQRLVRLSCRTVASSCAPLRPVPVTTLGCPQRLLHAVRVERFAEVSARCGWPDPGSTGMPPVPPGRGLRAWRPAAPGAWPVLARARHGSCSSRTGIMGPASLSEAEQHAAGRSRSLLAVGRGSRSPPLDFVSQSKLALRHKVLLCNTKLRRTRHERASRHDWQRRHG
jgi:hypothetical protein